jgi:hypothetical protein
MNEEYFAKASQRVLNTKYEGESHETFEAQMRIQNSKRDISDARKRIIGQGSLLAKDKEGRKEIVALIGALMMICPDEVEDAVEKTTNKRAG